jgi:peptidoglycan/xylan/chitin deacetylase (PgdA/CDA1 family)
VITRSHRGRPEVALTYDDGPGSCTRDVLDLLERYGARATFFMVGSEAQRDPGLAREVVARGHEAGSHSMHHLDHAEISPQDAVRDMLEGADAIANVLGREPQLYRAPYGRFVPATIAEAEHRGWTCVHWSTIGNDWEDGATGQSVSEHILPDLEPGAIAVLHDSRRAKPVKPEPVTGATAILLDALARQGLRARTVSEILS